MSPLPCGEVLNPFCLQRTSCRLDNKIGNEIIVEVNAIGPEFISMHNRYAKVVELKDL